jgi:hypothetical protein
MRTPGELRIEPAADVLEASRRWLGPVREALGHEFLAAYLTGSVLTQGFDPKRSRVNLLVVARTLDTDLLERVARAIPATRRPPHFEPLLLTRRQVEKSLDVFPIEWLDIRERHLLLEGDDIVAGLEVPQSNLRLQLEHELRGKHVRLRQTLLAAVGRPAELEGALRAAASGFAALFRTLLRLRGESPPADSAHVIERVADLYRLDASGLLIPHVLRQSGRSPSRADLLPRYKKFLVEVDRLITAIDELRVP